MLFSKKKVVSGVGGSVLLIALLTGTDAGSYARTGYQYVRSFVKASVPVEFEIDRARGLIEQVNAVVRQHLGVIAREEVELDKLAAAATAQEQHLAREKQAIVKLSEVVARQEHFVGKDRIWSPPQVQQDLSARFARYQTAEATLATQRETIAARQRGLQAARDKVEAMQRTQRKLETDVENLVARQRMVEVAQATSGLHFDSSHLARTQQAVDEIAARVSVAEKLVALSSPEVGEIPVTQDEEAHVLRDVAEHFALEGPQLVDAVNAPMLDSSVPEIEAAPLPKRVESRFDELLAETMERLFEKSLND